MKILLLLVGFALFAGCVSTDPASRAVQSRTLGSPSPSAEATDPEYGYSPEKPIKVGGFREGPARERAFLSELRGSAGELIRFERRGSCCPFPSPNAEMGTGLLDIYSVWIGSADQPKTLYLNMYDYETPLIPLGFSKRG